MNDAALRTTPEFSTPLQATKIVFLSGFGVTATTLGFVFFPPAGLLIAAPFVWKGSAWLTGNEDAQDSIGILSFVMDTILALVVTVLGFVFFPPAGAILGLMFVLRTVLSQRQARSDNSTRNSPPTKTGNQAFDAYKLDTLRRLEEEQSKFEAFLVRLRDAKDKTEFDRFMDDRSDKNN